MDSTDDSHMEALLIPSIIHQIWADNIKIFVSNNGLNPNSSENPEKAIVSLQNQEGTSYNMYIQVQNELTKAYNELRNEKSNID